jgi:hypothetical protein
LDNPCKSPDCPLERDTGPSWENATESTPWLFLRTCFLGAAIVFPPIVFLPTALVSPPPFVELLFFAIFFLTMFFIGVTLLPAVLFTFVCFFLSFFRVAIRAVYHR